MIAAAAIQKPKALRQGSRFAPVALASPAPADRLEAGREELTRLGFVANAVSARNAEGYFAGSAKDRRNEFLKNLEDPDCDALVGTRGGFGSVYLLEEGLPARLPPPKPLVGFSDLTTLQIYLWQKHRWTGFYGPMLGAGLDRGAGASGGYDQNSLLSALINTGGWNIPLQGEPLSGGVAEGTLLGGALTLLEATLGTPWEIDTQNAILVLEDRAMKPYQIDRVLMHLKHAGKFAKVRGFVLGDFPDCDPPVPGSPSVRDVCARLIAPLGVPVVYGAPVGHTARPLLTIPLGVRARLAAEGSGMLEILEPAVIE